MVWITAMKRKGGGRSGHRIHHGAAIVFLFLLTAAIPGALQGQTFAWGIDPPLMNNDPQWEKVKTLWAGHYGGKNLTELLEILAPLKDKYPNNVEPYLWLARVNYLHARYERSDRDAFFDKSEKYCVQALKIDPRNQLAIRYLVDTLCYSRDREYIARNYGALIKSFAPLPISDALPDLANGNGWSEFKKLWEARADIPKAQSAIAMMENMAAQNPNKALIQTWAARVEYYLGEYYTLHGEHDTKAMPYYKKGIAYAEKARKLQPNSVYANYWYQINLARSIQMTSLLNKARYLMDLLTPLLYCSRENSLYYFAGPVLCLGTMVTNGGWVTEKGMVIASINLDIEMNGLEQSEILYPDYLYIPYARADILAYKGKKTEAMAILEKIVAANPDANPLIPENRSFQMAAKDLLNDLRQGKRY